MALIEEKIVLREDGQKWKYSLSNNFDEIKEAVYKRSLIKINNIRDDEWEINISLSQDVKNLMYKNNVVYSMTVFSNNDIIHIAINKRELERWLFWGGVILNEKFISYNELDKMGLLDK